MIHINAQNGCVVNVTDAPINNVIVMGDMVQTKTVCLNHPSSNADEPQPSSTEAHDDAPSPLASPEAMELWKIARRHKWVDENLQPLVSINKAAILAMVMSDLLNLSPRWKAFEELWRIPSLSSKLSKAQNCEYYSDTLLEYKKAMTL